MIESIKVNKELMVEYFWAGIGFWTASEIIYNIVAFVKIVMGIEI